MGVKEQLDWGEHNTGIAMDAIKKKMQAMKVEKDNACDRSDVCEEASKVAKLRAEKAEDEVAELAAKSRQLETELDVTTEKLGIISLQLEEKEKALLAAEAEMNALKRSWLQQIPSLIRLELQLMTQNVQRKSLKIKLLKMSLRSLYNVIQISKGQKKEPMLERLRSWSW